MAELPRRASAKPRRPSIPGSAARGAERDARYCRCTVLGGAIIAANNTTKPPGWCVWRDRNTGNYFYAPCP